MADDARPPDPHGPSRAARWRRKAVVLAVVVVAALLLGRLGAGVDSGPATRPLPDDGHVPAAIGAA